MADNFYDANATDGLTWAGRVAMAQLFLLAAELKELTTEPGDADTLYGVVHVCEDYQSHHDAKHFVERCVLIAKRYEEAK